MFNFVLCRCATAFYCAILRSITDCIAIRGVLIAATIRNRFYYLIMRPCPIRALVEEPDSVKRVDGQGTASGHEGTRLLLIFRYLKKKSYPLLCAQTVAKSGIGPTLRLHCTLPYENSTHPFSTISCRPVCFLVIRQLELGNRSSCCRSTTHHTQCEDCIGPLKWVWYVVFVTKPQCCIWTGVV